MPSKRYKRFGLGIHESKNQAIFFWTPDIRGLKSAYRSDKVCAGVYFPAPYFKVAKKKKRFIMSRISNFFEEKTMSFNFLHYIYRWKRMDTPDGVITLSMLSIHRITMSAMKTAI